MIDLFYRGEVLYMSILTLLLLAIVIVGTVVGAFIFKHKTTHTKQIQQYLSYIKSIGLFSLIFGLFTQLLGLYGAFVAIEEWGSVSSDILFTGLQTSSIPSLYGLFIFLFSYLARQGFTRWLNQVITTE
ncbi:MAG: MotA/TolQ/ExbB proton channel family protein [Bacteroidota bacterium]